MFFFPFLLLEFKEIGMRSEFCGPQNAVNSFGVWLHLLFPHSLAVWDHETPWVLNFGNINWPLLLMCWLWFPISVDSKNGFPVYFVVVNSIAHSNWVGKISPTRMMSLSRMLWKTVFQCSGRSKSSTEGW